MRQGPNNRRSRGRGNGGGGGGGGGGGNGGGGGGGRRPSNVPLRHQTFDSNGPDVRIRGNAFQVYEKYLALARDAQSAGDRIAAENYLQHAEHYYRIIELINEQSEGQGQGQRNQQQRPNGHGGPNGGPFDEGDEGEEGEDQGADDERSVTA
jgi:hypothetical protein